jgi:hypothetical protein
LGHQSGMASEPALERALATGGLAVQPPTTQGLAGERTFAPAAFRYVTKLLQIRTVVYPFGRAIRKRHLSHSDRPSRRSRTASNAAVVKKAVS